MIKKLISVFTQFSTMSIATAILGFTVLGYTLYHFCTVADQTDFKEIVSDIQETLVYDDTTVMFGTGIKQIDFQDADDE